MNAIRAHAADLDAAPARSARLAGIDTLGVDEHIRRPSAPRRDRALTSIVDPTRDEHGRVHARLLDVTLGRSGPVCADCIHTQPRGFVDGITHASLDPFGGYPDAKRVGWAPTGPDLVTDIDEGHYSSGMAPWIRQNTAPR